MERTRSVAGLGTRPGELVAVARVDPARGPFLSVYLETEQATQNAAQLSEQRWRDLRASLADQGAGNDVLTRIDAVVPDAHLQGAALAVIADRERLLLVEHHPAMLGPPVARVAALPSLSRLVEWRQRMLAHLVVLADHRGADVLSFGWGREPRDETAGDADWPIKKVHAGGWSERRYQARAENTWEHNAHEVSELVTRLVEEEHPAFVGLGGDPRSIQLIEDNVPDEVSELFRPLSSGRAPDGSADALNEEAQALLELEVGAAQQDALVRHADAAGRGLASAGPDATLSGLAAGRVSSLLVFDSDRDGRLAWFGSDPGVVGPTRGDVEAAGESHPQEGRLADVAMRAAFGSGGSVFVLDSDTAITGGIAALMRWAEG